MRPKLLDTIVTLRNLPEAGIKSGTVGVVISIFDKPDETYEVEFADDEGRTIAQVVLRSMDFEILPAIAAVSCVDERPEEDR